MDRYQSAFLQMCAAVAATAAAHRPAWQPFAPFAAPFPRLETLRAAATAAAALQDTSSQGATESKAALREVLTTRATQLADILILWYKTTGANPQAAKDARTSRRSLHNQDEPGFAGRIQKLLTLTPGADATPPTPPQSLADLGITAAFITGIKADLAAFVRATGTPRHIIAEKVRGTQDLEKAIDDLRELLVEELDPAARVLGYTQPAFYSEYATSRKIVDPGYRTRALTVRISDAETGRPLEGVTASFQPKLEEGEKSTGPEGEFYVERMEAGTYQMALDRPGYAPKTVPVNIVDGEHTEVEETLRPA